MERIQREWIENEWVVVADSDPVRFVALAKGLEEIGFIRERILHAASASVALQHLDDKKAAILFLDEGLGTSTFREIHARMVTGFGELGFFFFAITEGSIPDFVQFAAEARIDGIIFRPYQGDEFRRRVAEVFTVKWPNRVVAKPESQADFLVRGAADREAFGKAMEREGALGHRTPMTPDGKIANIIGLREVAVAGVGAGKAAFTKVRLAFKAVARNGNPLEKTFPIHALEIDEERATFECAADIWEAGDHVTIEADIVHGEESFMMRIEALVQGEPGAGLMSVTFDKGNRTRFEAALKMVAKRFRELKDFFKYAKGA
jgi:DNA-binding NarL/FixJ family response regulator